MLDTALKEAARAGRECAETLNEAAEEVRSTRGGRETRVVGTRPRTSNRAKLRAVLAEGRRSIAAIRKAVDEADSELAGGVDEMERARRIVRALSCH